MSVRRAIVVSMVLIGVVAVLAAVALAVITDQLSETISGLNANLESVRAVQQVEVDLLIHHHAQVPLARTMLENDLKEGLRIVRQYVTSIEEVEAVNAAETALSRYVETGRVSNQTTVDIALNEALGAVRKVADVNIAQAQAVQMEAVQWNRFADRLGFGTAIIVFVTVPTIIASLALFAFRPMFGILHAMKAFASGDSGARVRPNAGMEELRTVGEQFNAMADAIVRQRQNQLTFLAGVSHDLRNPINALNISVAVMSDEKSRSPERQREMLRIIKRQTEFLNRLVDDLHEAHRIEAGQISLRKEVCDAHELAEDVCILFQSVSGAHRLNVLAPSVPVPVECDPMRLRQVLNNLVSNAIKYSPQGGDVSVAVNRSGEEVIIQVADHGMGIPREELPHIFEPFRRTALSKEGVPGTGLGLYVSRRIVEAHNGRIEVDSSVGKGTAFRIHLPQKAA